MEPHRRERIWTLLQSRSGLSLGDHARIQRDTLSTQARTLLPLLLPYIHPADGTQEAALTLLRAWDGDMRADSAAGALFAAWWRELPRALAAPDLGADLFKAYEVWPSYTDRFVRHCLRQLAMAPAEGDRARCEQIRAAIDQSFAAAIGTMRQRVGPDLKRWRWDRLHRAVFAHRPFHRRRWLRPFVSRAIATGGDWSSVNVGGTWSYDQPFTQKYAASYRQILDLSTPDHGLFIQALGQSGHPLSPHYADMAGRWQRGEYCPMRMSPAIIEQDQQAMLRLVPTRTH
jgi:penicillin amidase